MNSLAFLSPGPDAVAKSPMEPGAVASGASFDERAGWKVAVSFPNEDSSVVGFADLSHIGKLEIQGDVAALTGCNLELGKATRAAGVWWCPYSPTRAVVLCPSAQTVALRDHLTALVADADGLGSVVDITSAQGAMTILGTQAREVFARFTAIDLRPQITPVRAFRPGSVARTGGAILCEAPDRYLMLFGAALGQYVWTLVDDAARHLGGGPIGVDALPDLEDPLASDGAGPSPAASAPDGSSPEAPHA
jgi:heterotetrameric sarcosine oxidase gamma subunit